VVVFLKGISRPIRESFLWRWDVTPERIDELRENLDELGSIEIKFYTSTFSRASLEWEVTHADPSDVHESNHVDIFLDGTMIIQLLERKSVCLGTLFEENIPEGLQVKIENILRKLGYKVGKKENPHLKRRLFQGVAALSFVNAFVWTVGFLLAREYLLRKFDDVFPREFLKNFFPGLSIFNIVIGALWIVCGVIWIYRIKKTSFKG
jgi:hypothetical protein